MSERLPVEEIASQITILNGFAFPSSGFSDTGGLPLVRIRDLESSTTETRFQGRFDPRYLLKDGDVLIGMDGDFNVVRWSGGEALLNQRVCKVEARPGAIDPGFLYYSLKPKIAEIHRRTPQTTVRHLSTKAVERIELPTIRLRAQRRIAGILDTVDDAIRSTERLIAKLEQVKQGLLHDLLTRGIDENGDLRDPTRDREQFGVSRLGLIPSQWQVLSLQQISARIPGSTTIGPFGSNLVASDYRTSGIPVIFVRDVREDGFRWISDVYISEDKAAQLAAHMTRPGDVLATKMGLPPCVAALHPEHSEPAVITADIIRLRPDTDVIDAAWLVAMINSEIVRKQVRAITGGVTRPKVTLRDFRQLLIAVPPLVEQRAVRDAMASEDLRRKLHTVELSKLRLIKHGLMDDLLTGRVRVEVDDEDAA